MIDRTASGRETPREKRGVFCAAVFSRRRIKSILYGLRRCDKMKCTGILQDDHCAADCKRRVQRLQMLKYIRKMRLLWAAATLIPFGLAFLLSWLFGSPGGWQISSQLKMFFLFLQIGFVTAFFAAAGCTRQRRACGGRSFPVAAVAHRAVSRDADQLSHGYGGYDF